MLWAGQSLSQVGTEVSQLAVPLLAVTVLAATPVQMGVLTAAKTAAFLLVGLPVGAWTDRVRRRPVMIGADLARMALLATIPVAWWLGVLTLAQLVVVALLVGLATLFFDVADQSFLPALVGRSGLVEGNAKLEASRAAAHTGGPALAGALVQLVGAAAAVAADAVSYLVSVVFLSRIRPGRALRSAAPDVDCAPKSARVWVTCCATRCSARSPRARAPRTSSAECGRRWSRCSWPGSWRCRPG